MYERETQYLRELEQLARSSGRFESAVFFQDLAEAVRCGGESFRTCMTVSKGAHTMVFDDTAGFFLEYRRYGR